MCMFHLHRFEGNSFPCCVVVEHCKLNIDLSLISSAFAELLPDESVDDLHEDLSHRLRLFLVQIFVLRADIDQMSHHTSPIIRIAKDWNGGDARRNALICFFSNRLFDQRSQCVVFFGHGDARERERRSQLVWRCRYASWTDLRLILRSTVQCGDQHWTNVH